MALCRCMAVKKKVKIYMPALSIWKCNTYVCLFLHFESVLHWNWKHWRSALTLPAFKGSVKNRALAYVVSRNTHKGPFDSLRRMDEWMGWRSVGGVVVVDGAAFHSYRIHVSFLVWKAEMINYVKTSKDKPNDALLQTYTFFDMLGGSALAPQLTQSWNDKPM